MKESEAMSSHSRKSQISLNKSKDDSPATSPTAKEAAVEPSGPRGDNPSIGPGQTKVQSNTSENNSGHINPSAPEDVNITPGTAGTK
jgi:hypothetical protein